MTGTNFVVCMLLVDGVRYSLQEQANEEQFEVMIIEHSKQIFGESTVYFDIKHKLTSKAGIGSIPDAYVVDFAEPCRWYIVEVELASHPIDEHVMPQLNRFLRGIKHADSQKEVSDAIHGEIDKDEVLKAFVKTKIGSREIHRYLSDLVSTPPRVVVVIDDANEKVEEAVEAFKSEPIVVEFKTFVRENAENVHIHMFEPFNVKKIGSKEDSPDLEKERQFFKQALDELKTRAPHLTNARYNQNNRHAWIEIRTEKKGLTHYFGVERDNLIVDLYIYMGDKSSSQEVFDFFFRQKDEIEKEIGEPLAWERIHRRYTKASRIVIYKQAESGSDILTSTALRSWGINMLTKFRQVFSPRIVELERSKQKPRPDR